jgi:hypothetical protein
MKPRPNMPSQAVQVKVCISLITRIREKLRILRARMNDNAVLLPNLSRMIPTVGAATT